MSCFTESSELADRDGRDKASASQSNKSYTTPAAPVVCELVTACFHLDLKPGRIIWLILSRDPLPQTAADWSPPICGHPESVSVSTYSDNNREFERKIKSLCDHVCQWSHASDVQMISILVMGSSRNMQQELGAESGDVGNRLLGLAQHSQPPPSQSARLGVRV